MLSVPFFPETISQHLNVDPFFFSFLIPLNEICHVALSYLRMYACGPGTLWGEHPSEQVESIVQHLGRNI